MLIKSPQTGLVRLGRYVGVAFLLGYIIPRVTNLPEWLRSKSGPDPIIAFLSSISSGMMAFTGIVFSLLFVLLQFGATAYSPRIVDILGRNSVLYDAGGVFTGTFLYTLMALRGVGRSWDSSTSMLTIWVAFGWLLGSVYLLALLVQSLTGLTHTGVLHMLGEAGRRETGRLYGPFSGERPFSGEPPGEGPNAGEAVPGTPSQAVLHEGGVRYLIGLKARRLTELAQAAGALIRIPLAVGDPVAARTPLAAIYGADGRLPETAVRDCIELGREREIEGNPKYAIRLLVDIAIRALSYAVNDPTTAVQTLDQMEGLLLSLGNSNLDIGTVCDRSGQARVIFEATSWEEYLDLSLIEIVQYGANAEQVARRIDALLEFLYDNVPLARRSAIERWRDLHRVAVRSALPDAPHSRPEHGDRQGLGHAIG
jgi:uncharacterized membrane protein